ncbi:hypothetical protein ACH5RR_031167 [Cinchona calisaya]|uniref:F-box domain-containing protein n=1 Tax=Cinchona calisaya TaxID=153742 RepID=A0ABD2YHW9_9GENT
MKKREYFVGDSLPEDAALKIVSCLEVSDVCSLGSCSKFWREICGSDCLWKPLCEGRWAGVVLEEEAQSPDNLDHEKASTLKGWRGLYIKKHNEMVGHAAYLKKCLSCQAINVNDYLKAIEDMKSMQFGFKDVQTLLLKPKNSVLLNLVGLHYCIKELGVQVGCLREALSSSKIQGRQVHIQWWINAEGEEVLAVLEHGITREMALEAPKFLLILELLRWQLFPKSSYVCPHNQLMYI